MNQEILNKLKSTPELLSDEHGGSYELVYTISTNLAALIPGLMKQSSKADRGRKRHKICATLTKK